MDIIKKELYEVFSDSLEKSRTKEGGFLFDKLFEDMWKHIEPKLGQSLPLDGVSGCSMETMKSLKEVYEIRRDDSAKAKDYRSASDESVRVGVMELLISMANNR